MAKIKAGLLSLRDLFATAWWIFLIAGIGFVVAYQFVEPAPPRHVVMTSGGESGAYYHFAKRYAALLARDGITLEILPSEGSLQNLQRLQEGEAQIERFLADHADFTILPVAQDELPEGIAPSPDGTVRTLPDTLADRGHVDGFYIARMQRAN